MKILSFIAGFAILGMTIFFSNYMGHLPIPEKQTESLIGKKITAYNLWNINQRLLKSTAGDSRFVYVVISPTCPHCKNILRLLNTNKIYDSLQVHVYPIFKSRSSNTLISQTLKEENISCPVYKLATASIVDSIKLVPTFLYVKDGLINNIITGGTNDFQELEYLLKSLLGKQPEPWKKDNSYRQDSACSS